jgi:hypothetical protein
MSLADEYELIERAKKVTLAAADNDAERAKQAATEAEAARKQYAQRKLRERSFVYHVTFMMEQSPEFNIWRWLEDRTAEDGGVGINSVRRHEVPGNNQNIANISCFYVVEVLDVVKSKSL